MSAYVQTETQHTEHVALTFRAGVIGTIATVATVATVAPSHRNVAPRASGRTGTFDLHGV